MSVTGPYTRAALRGEWTVDDLHELPDDGHRYEIFDGSLLVTPPPAMPHVNTTYRMRRLLEAQAPAGFAVIDSGAGVYPNQRNYFIPDLLVIREELLTRDALGIDPHDALLAIEVVSPGNPGSDYVLKRHVYAVAGVRQYWIADERQQSLCVLLPDDTGAYVERAVASPGQPWRSSEPFPLVVDPAEIFR